MRHEITLTIKEAPGPFDSVQASAGYDIDNARCIPLSPGSGATIAPEKVVPIPLTPVSDATYHGVVYVDQLQDEDYYGLDVCHWKLTSVDAGLSVGQSMIVAGLTLKDLLSQGAVTRYFSNRDFTDSNLRGPDSGNASRSEFGSDAGSTFSVTIGAIKARP